MCGGGSSSLFDRPQYLNSPSALTVARAIPKFMRSPSCRCGEHRPIVQIAVPRLWIIQFALECRHCVVNLRK